MSCTAQRLMVLGLAVSIAWAAQAVDAVAATADLNLVADALVSAANANSNFGAAGALSLAASGLPKGEFQSVLMFDASAAKASFDSTFGIGQWGIQGITLRLTVASPGNPIFNSPNSPGQFSVSWMQNDSWLEGSGTPNAPTTDGITFNTLPSFLSAGDQNLGTFNFTGPPSGTTTSYLLTPAIGLLGDVAAGGSVSLRLLAADSSVSYVCNSRDYTKTPASRPTLSITAVPEPSSMVLLLAGGCALLGVAKRRFRARGGARCAA